MLEPGEDLVHEYASHFTRLARFAPELVTSEVRRVKKFTWVMTR